MKNKIYVVGNGRNEIQFKKDPVFNWMVAFGGVWKAICQLSIGSLATLHEIIRDSKELPDDLVVTLTMVYNNKSNLRNSIDSLVKSPSLEDLPEIEAIKQKLSRFEDKERLVEHLIASIKIDKEGLKSSDLGYASVVFGVDYFKIVSPLVNESYPTLNEALESILRVWW